MRHLQFNRIGDSAVRRGALNGHVVREYEGDPYQGEIRFTGHEYELKQVRLRAPLYPRHIIGIGKNFVGEGEPKPDIPELPVLFFKPLTTVIGPGDPILLPAGTDEAKFESELAVVIGKRISRIRPEEADDAIFGFTVANDVSASQHFHPDGHWTIGKSFDTFCPLGPWIETDFDYRSARIRARLNGAVKQDSSIEHIVTPVDRMISRISMFMTLMPGDVLLTGTPAGADLIRDGDTIECSIDGIGSLANPVASVRDSE